MGAPDVLDARADEQQRRWTDIVRQALRDEETPGACVALVEDGRTLFEAGVGFRDLAHSQPLTPDALFYVYSVTKLMIALAGLQLVEEGRLTLDTPAQTYLPTLPLTTPITPRQLLNHTAGVPDYGAMPAYYAAVRAAPTRPWTPEEFLARTLPGGLLFPPGQGWRYSNIGYLIVRLVLERVAGQSLRDILRQRLFAPLGLPRTFVAETLDDARVLTPAFSAFFRPEDGTLEDVTAVYHPGWVSHGVVISTAGELARLVQALFAGELLCPERLAEMLDGVPVPGTHAWFTQPSYGLGVMLDAQSPYGVAAGSRGGGPGYEAAAFSFSDVAGRRVTSVALVNRDLPDLSVRIARMLVADLAATYGRTG